MFLLIKIEKYGQKRSKNRFFSTDMILKSQKSRFFRKNQKNKKSPSGDNPKVDKKPYLRLLEGMEHCGISGSQNYRRDHHWGIG